MAVLFLHRLVYVEAAVVTRRVCDNAGRLCRPAGVYIMGKYGFQAGRRSGRAFAQGFRSWCPPCEFARPGSDSALRAGVRRFACPTCGVSDRLSQRDVDLGYQCDSCARRDEGTGF